MDQNNMRLPNSWFPEEFRSETVSRFAPLAEPKLRKQRAQRSLSPDQEKPDGNTPDCRTSSICQASKSPNSPKRVAKPVAVGRRSRGGGAGAKDRSGQRSP